MEIALYSRSDLAHSSGELAALTGALDRSGLVWSANTEFAEVIEAATGRKVDSYAELPSAVDMVVSYGGDGTFLDGVRLLDNRRIPITGINSGRLGFLANISKEKAGEALRDIARGEYTTEERTMVEVEGGFDRKAVHPFGFNEFTVQKNGVTMISADVYIDGEFITTYLGDGVILSTPAGSTAYSLSVGGPIVSPQCRCFVLAPIASHNLTVRPLVIPDSSTVVFRIHSRGAGLFATLDNRYFDACDGEVFTIRRSAEPVLFAKLRDISFYRTLRDKMMWGVDPREITK